MKRAKVLLLLTIGSLFLIWTGICLAFKVGNEAAQLAILSDDIGVNFVVVDPQGRKSGYDFETKKHLEEFPSSFAAEFETKDEVNDKLNGGGMMNLIPGTYTIEVFGVGLTEFEIGIGISRWGLDSAITNLDLIGITDKDLVSKFQFTYTSDPTKPAATATRIATAGSLKQDISLSRKIGWIDNDGIMKSLLAKADAIEASITKGDKETARNQLNAFINEVDAQKGKHIASYTEKPGYVRKGSKQVQLPKEGKAVKILLEDAQYMIEHL